MRGDRRGFSTAFFSFDAFMAAAISMPAEAYESGFAGYVLNPGITIGGATAAIPLLRATYDAAIVDRVASTEGSYNVFAM